MLLATKAAAAAECVCVRTCVCAGEKLRYAGKEL